MIDYTQLPEHMREGTQLWVEHGIMPGGFLTAVLENDLVGAFGKADLENRASMYIWCQWLFNEAPAGCWGSREQVTDWSQRGGLEGAAAG